MKSPLHLKSGQQMVIEGNSHLLKENQNYYVDIVCPVEHEPLESVESVKGLKRVCRYPTFWSNAALWLGCALKSNHYSALIMFTFPAVWALIGSTHQDRRYRRLGTMTPDVEEISCRFPFVALIQGKQSWSTLWDEIKLMNLTSGCALALYLNL